MKPRPPLTRLTHTLPFEKLQPADFERLCLWLVEREGYERAEALGEAGSEQGRDIVAWKDGRRVAFQCKRVRQFGPKSAEKEIEKIRKLPADEQPEELVFVVTCAVSAKTRKAARSAWGDEKTCHFWAGTELDERVKRHPEILEEFLNLGGTTLAETRQAWLEGAGAIAQGDGAVAAGARGVAIGKLYVTPHVTEPPSKPPPSSEALLKIWLDRVKIWLDRVARLHSRLMPYFQDREAPLLEHVYVELQLDPERLRRAAGAGTDLELRSQMGLFGRRLSIREVLDLDTDEHPWITRRWLLRGDPGSGKTTLLRHLAWTLADAGGEPWVPVFESLPRLMADDLSVLEHIEKDLRRADQPGAAIRELLKEEAKEGRLLLLLDGLDEVPRQARDRAEIFLGELAVRWPKNPIVATTRPIGAWSPGPEFLELEVLPFDAERRRAFLGRWFAQST